MTATTLEADNQQHSQNADAAPGENGSQNGSENVTPTAKQNGSGKNRQKGIRYLSEFIEEIPDTRRIAFIMNLKDAIKSGKFDGTPIAESFNLKYTGRGPEGAEERETTQRDFAVENSAAFGEWLAQEMLPPNSRPKYPSRQQFEGGQLSLAELATKFRQRGGTGKSKARR